MKRLPISVQKTIEQVSSRLATRPKLSNLFANCFPNCLETTIEKLDDGTVYVVTGDIPAMWLRDSSAQVRPYLRLAKDDPEIAALLEGVIKRQWMYVSLDPYANAFRKAPGHGPNDWIEDLTDHNPWEFERKYELDSLCYPIELTYLYWKATGKKAVFEGQVRSALYRIVSLWTTEQNHGECSPYRFTRLNTIEQDTLHNRGRGQRVNYTGMTWSGFRPSDDACNFGYYIPSNIFATVVLGYVETVAKEIYKDEVLGALALKLKQEILWGIQLYGTEIHPEFGTIYVQETDGFGNKILADDANIPSLLSMPYLGFGSLHAKLYQNTRRFILSRHNPSYFEGAVAKGIGSPHTPEGYVWHLSLAMQCLTSDNPAEIKELLEIFERTDAGTNLMHEGFHCDNPKLFTRPWFSWANSLFSEMILSLIERGYL